MATAVFEFVGQSIGGALGGTIGASIGGWIGSGVGAWIDGQVIATLTAPDPPRLNDLTVQVSTYGRPIAIMKGSRVRLAGNVIWSTGLLERREGGKGSPSQPQYVYSTSIAVALGEGVCERVKKIWANGKVIYDESIATTPLPATDTSLGYAVNRSYGTHAVFDTIRFYPGSLTQAADPTIQAAEGISETPKYKGVCYVVITSLALADFGNRIPNLEFLIQPKDGETVGEACADLVSRCGLDPAMVGHAQINDELGGYVISNRANGLGALQPLALAYGFDLAEAWGSLRLQPRGTAVHALIPVGELGARDAGTSRQEPVRWPRRPETELPKEAAITYRDPERDYQENTQRATRVSGSADANVSNEIPLTLGTDLARAFADRMLWEAWTSRQMVSVNLRDRFQFIEPGRCYFLQNAAGLQRIKIVRLTRGANGVHRVDLRRDRVEVYRSTAPGAVSPPAANEVSLPGDTEWQPLDIPILREQDDDAGFYWAANNESPGWRGMDLWRSIGGDYSHVDSLGTAAAMGTVATATPAGPAHVWDWATVITVVVDSDDDELTSVSEDEALNGSNLFWLGDPATGQGELLTYVTAALVAPNTYELSQLLRGRFGTEHAIGTHGVNERLVMLPVSGYGVRRSDFGLGDWGKERDYKPVSVLQTLADVTAEPFTNTGEGKRPYAPVQIESSRDGSDDVTIVWTRRSRIPQPGLGYGLVPIGEATEAYEVDILDGADVVRTIATATPEVIYTAAEQTADGLTPGDPIDGIIYQMSDVRGRGHGAEFTTV